MTTGSELFGWGEPGAVGGGQSATGVPDFVRNDRGDADDHWSRAGLRPPPARRGLGARELPTHHERSGHRRRRIGPAIPPGYIPPSPLMVE